MRTRWNVEFFIDSSTVFSCDPVSTGTYCTKFVPDDGSFSGVIHGGGDAALQLGDSVWTSGRSMATTANEQITFIMPDPLGFCPRTTLTITLSSNEPSGTFLRSTDCHNSRIAGRFTTSLIR